MSKRDQSHAAIQTGLNDLQDIRDRLRGNIRALSAGQFNSPSATKEHPQLQAVRARMAAEEARRGEGVANTIDAAFDTLRRQVVGDIYGAMDTIGRLEQFNAQAAQTAPSYTAHGAKPIAADVIDVEVVDVTASPPRSA